MASTALFLLMAGSTSLFAGSEGFPLERTEVDVDITGPVAEMTVYQTFRNDQSEFLEATYTFPLQEDAAVDAAVLRVGNREIRAEIHERGEAREIYEEAREEGRTASLTEQERPNIFTQSVANIPPGASIQVVLHVVQPMDYEDGSWRFVYPLVVGPRFVPAGVEDAARITPPVLPTTATDDQGIAHRVDIDVHAEMGMDLGSVWSSSHPEVEISNDGGRVDMVLEGIRADRDFVLDMRPAAQDPQVAFLAQKGHFSLLFEPDAAPRPDELVPRELVFVVDTSGSMSGEPLDRVKAAMRKALEGLRPGDSFRIVRFSDQVDELAEGALPATPINVTRGLVWVDALEAGGGTLMNDGLVAAFRAPAAADAIRGRRQRMLCLMSDGYIGNDAEILASVADRAGDVRVFAFGVGSSVNRYLLEGIALEGRGVARIVLPEESPEAAVADFYARIAQPVITDLSIDWGDMGVTGVYPQKLPDLFTGQPLRLVGQYDGRPGTITVKGRMGDGSFSQKVDMQAMEKGTGIPSLWARARIGDLDRQLHWGEDADVKGEITETALRYRLLSEYTSFVAVEREIVNPDGYSLHVDQPLEIPQDVSYKGVFGEARTLDDSVGMSRSSTRPGDPLLTVDAPADAQDVAAVLPWGELVRLAWDPRRNRWFHRFLVPREVAEGNYTIQVFVTMANGEVLISDKDIAVDGSAPEFEVEAEWVPEGTLVRLYVEEPLRSFQVYPVGQPELRKRADLRLAEWADREVVELLLDGHPDEVTVVVKDLAFNREARVVQVTDRDAEQP